MLLLVVTMLTGCLTADQPTPIGPIGDESQSTGDYCVARGTFCAGFGAACNTDYSPFCAGGVGLCNAGRCEHFCSAIDWPRCTSGVETHTDVSGVDVCLCVPS